MHVGGTGRIVVAVIFLLFLGVGLLTFRDYGVYSDELANRSGFQKLNDYVKSVNDPRHGPVLLDAFHYTHGLVFDAVARKVRVLLGFSDQREILYLRHLLGFLTFYTAVMMLFALCSRFMGCWQPALLASVLLVMMPQVYCYAFVDNVDIPFMSFFLAATLTLRYYLDRPTLKRAVLHAVTSALAMGMRLAGGIIVLATVVFLVGTWLGIRRRCMSARQHPGETILSLAIYLVLTGEVVFLLWPALWADPFHRFQQAIHLSMYVQSDVNSTTGQADPLYLAESFLVTTPVLYSLLFALGFIASVRHLWRPLKSFPLSRYDTAFCLFLLCLPLSTSAISGTRHYGLLRHFFFILPMVCVMMSGGFFYLWRRIEGCKILAVRRLLFATLIGVVCVTLADSLSALIELHTYENFYRSRPYDACDGLKRAGLRPDLEEQCTLERKALEYIAAHDAGTFIGVCGAMRLNRTRHLLSGMALPPVVRNRLWFAEPSWAKYALSFGEPSPDVGGRLEYRTSLSSDVAPIPVKRQLFSISYRGRRAITVYELY